ncbi:lipopolysaccharide biosynthesis protein [soil metagenome]
MKKIISVLSNRHTLSLAGNLTNAVLGFLSIALVARLLLKDDMGAWFMFMTGYILADLLRAGIIHTSLIRFAASSDDEKFKEVSGSGWMISMITTLILTVVTLGSFFLFGKHISNPGFKLFLEWYWIAAITTLPFNYAAWLLQSKSQFDKVLYIRLLNQLSFMTCVLIGLIFNYNKLEYVLFSFVVSGLLPSAISMWAGWSMIHTMRYATKSKMLELFNFGKFSMGTLMGSNLLRSSDTILIGFLLTTRDVAIYAIPLKLIEVIEILLRSFVSTAMPEMSKYSAPEHKLQLREMYYKYTGLLSIILLPVVIACFIFADTLVILLGGAQYAESANILRVLAVYAAFLPLDRFSGITLDIIGKPYLNFIKVILMLVVNVSGDLIAIHFTKSTMGVAAVSILTFITGVIFGNYFLKKYLNQSIRTTLIIGIKSTIHILEPVTERFKSFKIGTPSS